MTPEKMREALAIVDMLDGIANVRKNALGEVKVEWVFSSVTGNSTVRVRLDEFAAKIAFDALVKELRQKFAYLGGEWDAS